MKIYSLGTSTRTIEEFMGILKAYAIEVAADVKPLPSFPRSGTRPFSQRGGVGSPSHHRRGEGVASNGVFNGHRERGG
jgi:hypothetical protein